MSRQLRIQALLWAALAVASAPAVRAVSQAGPERRIALVIGNDRYSGPMVLQNARRDATAIATELRTPRIPDDPRRGRDAAAADSGASRRSSSTITPTTSSSSTTRATARRSNGENYLIPVDYAGTTRAGAGARRRLRDARFRPGSPARACRSSCSTRAATTPTPACASGGSGLAAMEARGSLVAFATGAGADRRRQSGRRARHVHGRPARGAARARAVDPRGVLPTSGSASTTLTNGRQFPAVYDNLLGDIVLRPAAGAPARQPAHTTSTGGAAASDRVRQRRSAGVPPSLIAASPAPSWLVGDFRGVNPGHQVERRADGSRRRDDHGIRGRRVGTCDSRALRVGRRDAIRSSIHRGVHVRRRAHRQRVPHATGRRGVEHRRRIGACTCRRCRRPLPARAPLSATSPRRATPDELATMIAVINEWAPAWETLNEAAGRAVYPTWNVAAVRAARDEGTTSSKVSATTVTCAYATVRRDQADCPLPRVVRHRLQDEAALVTVAQVADQQPRAARSRRTGRSSCSGTARPGSSRTSSITDDSRRVLLFFFAIIVTFPSTPQAQGEAPSIVFGTRHGVALRTNGDVLTWGEQRRVSARPPAGNTASTPAVMCATSRRSRRRASTRWRSPSTARSTAWGVNGEGQLGMGVGNTYDQCEGPVLVPSLDDKTIAHISTGVGFSVAVTSAGDLWCSGDNGDGAVPARRKATPRSSCRSRFPDSRARSSAVKGGRVPRARAHARRPALRVRPRP